VTVLSKVLVVGAVVILGLTGAASVAYGLARLLAYIARTWGTDEIPLPPLPKFDTLSPQEAEAIRARAAERRKRAEHRHTEGHAIASGQPPESPIKFSDTAARKRA